MKTLAKAAEEHPTASMARDFRNRWRHAVGAMKLRRWCAPAPIDTLCFLSFWWYFLSRHFMFKEELL